MAQEKFEMIPYNGNQISFFSDERYDYINLTDIANAVDSRKSILTWLRNIKTVEFLHVWEKKNNRFYDGSQLSTVHTLIQNRELTIKKWVEMTHSKGIFTKSGEHAGTYAHKDIAIKYAGWLSAEFELYLIEEIQRLKGLENKQKTNGLHSEEEVLRLVGLKEVFKYVAHQEIIEEAHKDVFVARSGSKNPYAEFAVWRNKILGLEKEDIDDRIKQYCIDNKIPLTKKVIGKSKRDKVLLLDSYESVRNAVWDFLEIEGEVNSLSLANFVHKMIRAENGEVYYKNEADLFREKQNLGIYSEFEQTVSEMPIVKKSREVLEFRKPKELRNKQ